VTTPPPRLVAVTSTAQVSGAERVLLRTLAAAVDAGWEVTCLCPPGPMSDQLRETGAGHVVIPELHLGHGPRPLAAMGTIVRWWRAGRTLRGAARAADVVLANTLLSLPAVRLARLRRLGGRSVPAVWLAHDVVVSSARLRLYAWSGAALSLVVGVSHAVVAQLRGAAARAGGPPLEVVHNGVAFPVEQATERVDGARDSTPERPAVVGLNGLLVPWKGQEVLLEAVPLVEGPLRVEFLGGTFPQDAAYADRLRDRIDELGLGDRVELLGHHPDPLGRMRGWTVAVSASTDPEACPLAVLEAMSMGLPVVATDHGGAPEVLAGAGMLVPPRDPAALARAITTLVGDAELRRRSAEQGLARVASAHRVDVQTRLLLDRLVTASRQGVGR
jgi:glycosyltransferase involved in cell wall biosynthesis